MLFYAALHYVDAYLAAKPLHPPSHASRDNEIQNNGSLSAIYKDHRRLKDKSVAARCEIANFHRSQLPTIKLRFEKIKVHLLSKLR